MNLLCDLFVYYSRILKISYTLYREESQGVAAAVDRAQKSQAEPTVSTAPEPTVSTAPEPVAKSNGDGSNSATQAADDDFDDFDPRGTFTATPGKHPF